MENEVKFRLLYICKILYELTDENNPLSTVQIMDILKNKYGISSHRITVGNDIEILREFGIDIYKIESTQNKYFISSRAFELPELKLMIDAIESSRLITKSKTKKLIDKISELSSINQAKTLKRNTHTDDRLKPKNEKIYYIIDTINEAINTNHQISFKYFKHDVNMQKQLRHGGETYTFSPYSLVWSDDYYYMVGYSHKYESIGCFRIDRIAGTPQILPNISEPMPKGFSVSEHLKAAFRMFGGEYTRVELLCENDMMDALIDKFGENIHTSNHCTNTFKARVEVCVNPIFFRWVFGFGGKIKILSPQSVKEKYADMVKKAYENI